MAKKKAAKKKQPSAKKKGAKKRLRLVNSTGGSLGLRTPLPHGRAISAQEFEIEVGRIFSVEQFASLCNAIAWCVGSKAGLVQVSFTERVNVADNGIDAEWTLELPIANVKETSIAGPGWNVFQYKKRDITAQDRKSTVTELVSNLKGALKYVTEKENRQPDRYVLFTNVHLTKSDKQRLVKSIKKDSKQPEQTTVVVLGAAELAASCNDLPHIRSGYFSTSDFATWSKAWTAHNRQKFLGASVKLTGRQQLLEEVRSAVDDKAIRVILVAGAHQIGKSRIAFEATEHRQLEVVVGLDALSISAGDLFGLGANASETLIIVEDVDSDRASQLANATLGQGTIKLILTVPTTDPALTLSFGLDPRVKQLLLSGLSDQDSAELLKLAGASFDYSVESWVVHQAGGNPGILLAAAQVTDLRNKAESFTDQIARAFEKKVKNAYGDKALQAIRVISLLTHVGYKDKRSHELKIVADFLGVRLNDVVDAIDDLCAAGIVRTQGSFLEVTPTLFACYEAVAAIRGRTTELRDLLLRLDSEGQRRLIRRLRTLQGTEISAFWDGFFSKSGPFADFSSALEHGRLLRSISIAVPDRAAQLIYDGLSHLSRADRITLTGYKRRELMWTLEDLLFRRSTSERALRSVGMLADAENEGIANNATGVFRECFYPIHPQFPLDLERRLKMVQEALAEGQFYPMSVLAVKAIATAFDPRPALALRRSDGPTPFDARPEMTWGEIWSYLTSFASLVWTACKSSRESVSKEACSALPRILYGLVTQTPPLEAAKFCEKVVAEILKDKLAVSLHDLCADMILGREWLDSLGDDDSRKANAKEAVTILDHIVTGIEESSFGVRLKRWVGGWHSGKYETDSSGTLVFESDKKIAALAQECVSTDDFLMGELLDWLVGPEAKQNSHFFHSLGRYDKDGKITKRLEKLAEKPAGATAFGMYFGGLSTHSREAVDKRLDDLAQEGKVCGMGLVYATIHLPGDRRSVDRVRLLLSQNKIEPDNTARLLSGGGWPKNLTTEECYDLSSAIAGCSLINATAVIDFLAMWAGHYKKLLEGKLADLAWRCLEAIPTKGVASNADLLASILVGNDADRGFRLLELLMNQPYKKKGWQPIDHHSTRMFWDALHGADRNRLLRVVFGLNFKEPTLAFSISWHLPDLINWDEDKEILSALAVEDEDEALIVLQCTSRAGLWPLAIELLQRFPDNKKIRSMIVSRADHAQEVIVGPQSSHYEQCASEIKTIIDDSNTPASVRAFLKDLHDRFRDAARDQKRIEEDEAVNW